MLTSSSGHSTHKAPRRSALLLSVAAIGVVFGDIGTSPLYALRACFEVSGVEVSVSAVLGILSLIFWSLLLVISVKYIGIILRADNDGEGGVLALMTLVLNERRGMSAPLVAVLGLAGTALFFGDGVITPAITVLSAVEGLRIITPEVDGAVIPLALVVLMSLFLLQRRGTGAIGKLFGPVMIVWFLTLAALGVGAILNRPAVLVAANPAHAMTFFVEHTGVSLAVFGAVFLVVTGGEALYADLGHFGRRPIARAWFLFVWPCLALNYFGQGALLLGDPSAIENPFFLLAPEWLLVPLVVLATVASVIASQAVLSGVFAIAQQCQRLGYMPRLEIRQTSEQAIGQVYVPTINWVLCVSTLGLTVGFGSSENLASAYGVGVSSTMLIDSILILLLLSVRRDIPARSQLVILAILVVIDAAFLAANLMKIPTGGWFPIAFGLLVFGIMQTWQRGRGIVTERMAREEETVARFLARIAESRPLRVPGVAVYMTGRTSGIPRTLVRNLKYNHVLHETVILFSLATERIPRVLTGGRTKVEQLSENLYRVTASTGFMELPRVPVMLREAERAGLDVRTEDAVFFLAHDNIVVGTHPRGGMSAWRKELFLFLARNAQYAAASYSIPPSRVMEVGGQLEI